MTEQNETPETENAGPATEPKQEMIGDLTREEFDRRRKGRNLAIGVALAVFVILVWAVAIFRIGPAILERPM